MGYHQTLIRASSLDAEPGRLREAVRSGLSGRSTANIGKKLPERVKHRRVLRGLNRAVDLREYRRDDRRVRL